MAKIYDLDGETLNVFDTILGQTGLQQTVKVGVYGKKMKNDLYKVAKANDVTKFETDLDVVIYLDENIFDLLEPEQQKLIAEEAICCIGWDSEKDILLMSKPDIQTYTGILSKFTNERVIQTKQAIKLVMESRKQSEKEAKE